MGYWIAIFLMALGWGVDRYKLYGLIAGYNTMSKEEKAKVRIEDVARLMRNTFFGIGAVLIFVEYFGADLGLEGYRSMLQSLVVVVGVIVMLIQCNGERYKK